MYGSRSGADLGERRPNHNFTGCGESAMLRSHNRQAGRQFGHIGEGSHMNIMRSLSIFGTFAIVALSGSNGAHALNLLTNGSFEDTTNFVNQGNDTMDLPVGSTLISGWTVS